MSDHRYKSHLSATSTSTMSCRSVAAVVLLLLVPAVTADAQSTPVSVAPVIQRDVSITRMFEGTVHPTRRSITGAAVSGRVSTVLVQEGDRVEAGQPLAKLITDTTMLELEAEQAELDFRTQQLAELEAGTRPGEIERAKAQMAGAEARMEFLHGKRQRTAALFEKKAATKGIRDEGVSLALVAEQEFQEAKATYELAVEGPRQEEIGQVRAQVRKQRVLVEQIADQIRDHTILAPFDGYVTATHTEAGQWVAQGAPVAEIVAVDSVDVVVPIPESHVGAMVIGAEVQIEVPSNSTCGFRGRLISVVPQADILSRTFPVKLRVENRLARNGPALRPGMHARVALPTGPSIQALLVPKDALVISGSTTSIFVVDGQTDEGAQVRPVSVESGIGSGEWVQVTGSLKPGQKVVVRGNERLKPGQYVFVSNDLVPNDDMVLNRRSDDD